MDDSQNFEWTAFYMEFAEKLCPYITDRTALIQKIKAVYSALSANSSSPIHLPTLEKDNNIVDIDPFTVFGLFNKGITHENRTSIIRGLSKEFDVKAAVPTSFDGIPVLNNQSAAFYQFIDNRGEHDIDVLWNVFIAALNYAQDCSAENRTEFIRYYNIALHQKKIKWNLTMGLYWVCPYEYVSLDGTTRWFLTEYEKIPEELRQIIGGLKTVPSGSKYLEIIQGCRQFLMQEDSAYKTFPALSYCAWRTSDRVAQESKETRETEESDVHVWLYTPGYGAVKWDDFYENGIMAIAREYLGDLSQYETKADIKNRMKECSTDKGTTTHKNAALEAWQFVHDIYCRDVIIAKKGLHTILGWGVVTSDYRYDETRPDEYKNVRSVKWLGKGEWPYAGSLETKVLTDITPYPALVEEIFSLAGIDENTLLDSPVEEAENTTEEKPAFSYTEDDFLSEVYMSREQYRILSHLLLKKKNVILQGAPGVGKTFAAERLAYTIVGSQNSEQIMMVQFHQSYSYEDFIMGYRPNQNGGFDLKYGPFYKFCKEAEAHPEQKYVFMIDEINRGNLSKIFGELFMLIECDKRGKKLPLLYSDKLFSVPENLYLIGMMNTADRSLAMVDYALRRRFAFFEMSPAFDSEGFHKYLQNKNSKKLTKLVSAVKRLNSAIKDDDSLGKGFCIGHSYFCAKQGEASEDEWLESIVDYELLPLLEEYWFDEAEKVQEWARILHEAIQ